MIQNLLEMVQSELQRPDVNLSEVQRSLGKTSDDRWRISYDTLLRIKLGSKHDPSWSNVYLLAQHLLSGKRRKR